MKHSILFLLAILLFMSCESVKKPAPNDAINIISDNALKSKSYDIPVGIFRGVLWPDPNGKEFTIWLIRNHKELFFKLSAPPEISNWKRQVTEQWQIKKTGSSSLMERYTATKTGSTASVIFDLPKKKRAYWFYVLANEIGQESILFMDLSEDISDQGIFGYIVLK